MKLADCVVLVTGGSSGLGAAVSLMAWEAGARVLIADRAAPRDDNPLRLRDPQGERWLWQATDVSDEAQASAAVNQAFTRFGRLDVLVNAAGVAAVEKVHGRDGPHQLASFQKVIQVNLLGSFNMMRLAAAAMLASPARPGSNEVDSRGVIVNTASIAAFDGQMGQVAYAASKGGVVAMTLPAARDLAPHNAWFHLDVTTELRVLGRLDEAEAGCRQEGKGGVHHAIPLSEAKAPTLPSPARGEGLSAVPS